MSKRLPGRLLYCKQYDHLSSRGSVVTVPQMYTQLVKRLSFGHDSENANTSSGTHLCSVGSISTSPPQLPLLRVLWLLLLLRLMPLAHAPRSPSPPRLEPPTPIESTTLLSRCRWRRGKRRQRKETPQGLTGAPGTTCRCCSCCCRRCHYKWSCCPTLSLGPGGRSTGREGATPSTRQA